MSLPLASMRILIVEDDPVFCCVLAGFLHAQGAVTSEVTNGVEALASVEKMVPDLIFCDLTMPKMGGIEFIHYIRGKGVKTPVIVVSATEEMADIAKAMRLGVCDVILKPVTDFNRLRNTLLACIYPDIFFSPALEEDELLHDWDKLSQEPQYAIDLLKQLQPPVQQRVAGCKVSYRQLTLTEDLGLVLDILPLSAQDFIFYTLDISHSATHGILGALIVRAIFNSLLQEMTSYQRLPQIITLLEQVNQLLRRAHLRGQFPLLVGYYHSYTQNLLIVSAGLNAEIQMNGTSYYLNSGVPLGMMDSLHVNQLSQHTEEWQGKIWGDGGKLRLMLSRPK